MNSKVNLNTLNTPSLRLKAKLDMAFPVLQAQAAQLWNSPFVRDLYPVYLQNMYMVVRSGVPLMHAAIQTANYFSESDKMLNRLIGYLTHHMEEERGHDHWLLEDYEATGGNPDALQLQMPSSQVATLVGAQYYWIYHYHPVTLMGHIAALETYHPPKGFAKHLSGLTGYPMHAFRAIARHEKLDIVHKRELYKLIDELKLTEQQERSIGLSGLHTMQTAVDVLADIYEKSKKRSVRLVPHGIQPVPTSLFSPPV
ncbi:MAG: hypothetical protein QE278_00385 [Limnobacter sp.]|nr:hypothetical protein [Limnobacter sp.]